MQVNKPHARDLNANGSDDDGAELIAGMPCCWHTGICIGQLTLALPHAQFTAAYLKGNAHGLGSVGRVSRCVPGRRHAARVQYRYKKRSGLSS